MARRERPPRQGLPGRITRTARRPGRPPSEGGPGRAPAPAGPAADEATPADRPGDAGRGLAACRLDAGQARRLPPGHEPLPRVRPRQHRGGWNRPPGTPRQFVGHAVVRRVGNILSPNLAARRADVRHRREDRLPALHHLAEARGNEGQRRRRNHCRVNAEPDGAGTKPAPTARASGFHGVADGPPRPRGGVLRMARCQVRDRTIARGTVPNGDVKYRCQLVFRQHR